MEAMQYILMQVHVTHPMEPYITTFHHLFLSVSSFYPMFSDDLSVISPDAEKFCVCEKDEELGDCFGTQLSVYPGQIFGLPVAVLGDTNGLVKRSVNALVSVGNFRKEV